MTRVLFTTPWESGINKDGSGWEHDYVNHNDTKLCDVHEGVLHGFFQSGIPADESVGIYPIAIVEDENGYLHELRPGNIKIKYPEIKRSNQE